MNIEKLIERLFIGWGDIKHAITTVPSFFIFSQKQSIRDKCKRIGVNILRIVNEESAVCYACYAYGLHQDKMNKNILVFYLWNSETKMK